MRPTWSSSYPRSGETPVVYALLIAMGVAFFIDFFTHDALTALAAWPISGAWLHSLELWRPFTFPFVHGNGFWYILTDGLVVYFFGGSLERAWGSAKFLVFFFAVGIVAGLCELALAPWTGGALFMGMVGGFAGMVVAFAALNPYQTVLFYFFPIQARWLAVIAVAFELFGRTGVYGGPFSAVVAVGATTIFAYLFSATRLRWPRRGLRGPSLKDRWERWQQRRRMRAWQKRVARASKPEDLFKEKK